MEIYYDNKYTYRLTGIQLDNNPFESPPVEIVKQGRKAIKIWFDAHKKGKQQTLNEVKVLLVGDGDSGKTSIKKCLMGQDFNPNEPQTHRIQIEDWNFKHNDIQIKPNILLRVQ